MCLAQKQKNHTHDSSRGRGDRRRHGKKNNRGKGGKHYQGGRQDLHCICSSRNGHVASTCKLSWDRIKQERNEEKGKTPDLGKGKAHESAHYIVAHYNIGVNEDMFNNSLASWKYAWFLHTDAAYHMTFHKY